MRRELSWEDSGKLITRNWISESNFAAPKKILLANDTLKADFFYQQTSQGAAFIWQGDFQNAKQLLQAVQRRITKSSFERAHKNMPKNSTASSLAEHFHRYRQSQAHRAQILSRLLICVESDFSINLRRSPDIHHTIAEALPNEQDAFVISLQELLGFIGAHEWRKKGVYISSLDNKIHPHYGLFSPVRGEYLDLLEKAQLPSTVNRAFDIGTGTGVIAALLAKRGLKKIIATDLDPRALSCATENIFRLGYDQQVEIIEADLFPTGKADLIVCNPPWVPARPTSRVERAIYDENSQMLKGFLKGAHEHMTDHGESWLILSNLAELLGLRKPNELSIWIAQAQLVVLENLQIRPRHPKSKNPEDPLYKARASEITNLWRLGKKPV